MPNRVACAVVLLAFLGCSRPAPAPGSSTGAGAPQAAATAPRESLGSVMAQVGRRFELAGRAAAAGRFELAGFEAGELGELFESDVPNAEPPKEGPTAHIPAMAKAFLETNAPALAKAAAAKDRAAFASTFARTAAACNMCHFASAKAFIEVPTEPGKPVPDLDPVPPVNGGPAHLLDADAGRRSL